MNIYKDIIIHQKLSSSTQEQRVLLSCGGQYYEASPAIAELVETLQRHATEEEAIAAYTEKKEGRQIHARTGTADYRQVHYAPLYAQATEAVFPLREGTVQRGGG